MKYIIYAAFAAILPFTSGCADLSAPRLSGHVTTDGRLNEPMWSKAADLEDTKFTRWVDNTYIKDPSDFDMKFFHDGTTLYGALISHDRYVEADADPENSDGLYSLSILTPAGKVKHYRLRWSANPSVAAGDMLTSAKWGEMLLGPYNATNRPGFGYVYEFAIPLADIGWKPGDTIPINIVINDRDGTLHVPYRARGAEFARFAWGSFDNDNLDDYKKLKLNP